MVKKVVTKIGPAHQPEYSPGVPAYRVEFEEAREAEDYHSLYRDFESVAETTRVLAETMRRSATAQSHETPVLVGAADHVSRSLWTAAVVTYGRCFHHGKRRHLNEDVFEGQPDDMLRWHRYFRNLRDKHVSHSVSPFEEYATGVYVEDREGDDPRVDRVVVINLTRVGETVEVVENLERLAVSLQRVMYQRHNAAMQKVIDKADSMSKEKLRRLPPLEMQPEMGLEAARKVRR